MPTDKTQKAEQQERIIFQLQAELNILKEKHSYYAKGTARIKQLELCLAKEHKDHVRVGSRELQLFNLQKQNLADHSNELVQLKSSWRARQLQSKDLTLELESLKAKLSNWTTEAQSCKYKYQNASRDKNQLQVEKEQLQDSLHQVKMLLGNSNRRLTDLLAKKDHSELKLNETEHNRRAFDKQLVEMVLACDSVKQQILPLGELKEKTACRLQELGEIASQLTTDQKEIRKRVSREESNLDSLCLKCKLVGSELANTGQTLACLQGQINDLKGESQLVQEQIRAYEDSIEEDECECEQLLRTNSQLASDLLLVKQQIESMGGSNFSLEEELQRVRQEDCVIGQMLCRRSRR